MHHRKRKLLNPPPPPPVPDWSRLPDETISNIACLLLRTNLCDFLSLKATCKSWRSVATEKKIFQGIHQFPWLMLSEKNTLLHAVRVTKVRRFYNLHGKKFHSFYLPDAHRRRCWGSAFGWLITIGLDLEIHLLNPVTSERIELPSQEMFEKDLGGSCLPEHLLVFFLGKVVMSRAPDNGSCVVMVIYSHYFRLAFVRPGDKKWTTVKGACGPYKDIIWFDEMFYAVDGDGMLRVCDVRCREPRIVDFAVPPVGLNFDTLYLVVLNGCIHLISRLYFRREGGGGGGGDESDERGVVRFYLFKLDLRTRLWERLDGCGDYALFVGNNGSFALLASDYLEMKRNCVYFTDDYGDEYGSGAVRSTGIFSFKDNGVEFIDLGEDMRSVFSRTLWITPNPWSIEP